MRVKGGSTTRQRRKAMKRRVEGSWGTRHTSFKIAHQTFIQAQEYAYRDRKNKKRDFRKLWIARINAACRPLDITYSQLINGLKKQNVAINRKMLSELAINDKEAFANLVKIAKNGKVENKTVVKEAKKEVKA